MLFLSFPFRFVALPYEQCQNKDKDKEIPVCTSRSSAASMAVKRPYLQSGFHLSSSKPSY